MRCSENDPHCNYCTDTFDGKKSKHHLSRETNTHYERVMDALQPMEELCGPELGEYIQIMEDIEREVSLRIAAAKHYKRTGEK